jgi:arsenate reductase
MKPKKNILVLCAHNSARSQMAEALLRKHGGDKFTVYSAGLDAIEIHPLTHCVMAEMNLPLERHHAKSVRDFLGNLVVHHLIIVCERTELECPRLFLGARRRHFWPFPDPASVEGEPEKQIAAFRAVRDDIQRRVLDWLGEPDAAGNDAADQGPEADPEEAR